jgi:integral membrane protein
MFKFDTTLNRLCAIGILEAISFLLLLGIAMPLKYMFGHPEMVRVVGMAHGVLWILYIAFAGLGQLDYKWSWKTTAMLVIASLLPLGPIIADAKVKKQISAQKR